MRPNSTKNLEVSFLSSFSILVLCVIITLNILIKYEPPGNFILSSEGENITTPTEVPHKLPTVQKPISSKLLAKQTSNNNLTSKKNSHKSLQVTQISEHKKISYSEIDTLLIEARKMINTGDSKNAITNLEKILVHDPQNNEALTELGLVYLLDLRNNEKAKSYLEKAVFENPDNQVALSELVDLYSEEEGTAGLEKLKKLYENNPNNPTLAYGLGQLLVEDDPRAASVYLETAIQQGADTAAFSDLAEAYELAGNSEKALETFKSQRTIEYEKWKSGAYSSPEVGRQRFILSQINVIGKLLASNQPNKADQEIKYLKQSVGDEDEFKNIMEILNLRRSNSSKKSPPFNEDNF